MGTTNFGGQILSFDYKNPATAKEFNRLNYQLHEPGIYNWQGKDSGNMPLTRVNDTTVTVAPMTFFITDSSNSVGVRIQTTVDQDITASSTLPYIVWSFTWSNAEQWYADLSAKAFGNIAAEDVVIGRCVFDGNTLLPDFDYTRMTIPRLSSDDDTSGGPTTDALIAKTNEPVDARVFVEGGVVRTKTGNIEVTPGVTSPLSNIPAGFSRIDLIWIDENGNKRVTEGDLAPSDPPVPEYTYRFVIAEIHRTAVSSDVSIVTGANIKNVKNRNREDIYEIMADLSSNSSSKGASLVGIEDVAGKFSSSTVEGALSETGDVVSDGNNSFTGENVFTGTTRFNGVESFKYGKGEYEIDFARDFGAALVDQMSYPIPPAATALLANVTSSHIYGFTESNKAGLQNFVLDSVSKFDKTSGSEIWKHTIDEISNSSGGWFDTDEHIPLVQETSDGQSVFAIYENSTTAKGKLRKIDAISGSFVWEYSFPDRYSNIMQIAPDDSEIYVTHNDSSSQSAQIFALDPNDTSVVNQSNVYTKGGFSGVRIDDMKVSQNYIVFTIRKSSLPNYWDIHVLDRTTLTEIANTQYPTDNERQVLLTPNEEILVVDDQNSSDFYLVMLSPVDLTELKRWYFDWANRLMISSDGRYVLGIRTSGIQMIFDLENETFVTTEWHGFSFDNDSTAVVDPVSPNIIWATPLGKYAILSYNYITQEPQQSFLNPFINKDDGDNQFATSVQVEQRGEKTVLFGHRGEGVWFKYTVEDSRLDGWVYGESIGSQWAIPISENEDFFAFTRTDERVPESSGGDDIWVQRVYVVNKDTFVANVVYQDTSSDYNDVMWILERSAAFYHNGYVYLSRHNKSNDTAKFSKLDTSTGQFVWDVSFNNLNELDFHDMAVSQDGTHIYGIYFRDTEEKLIKVRIDDGTVEWNVNIPDYSQSMTYDAERDRLFVGIKNQSSSNPRFIELDAADGSVVRNIQVNSLPTNAEYVEVRPSKTANVVMVLVVYRLSDSEKESFPVYVREVNLDTEAIGASFEREAFWDILADDVTFVEGRFSINQIPAPDEVAFSVFDRAYPLFKLK